MANLFADKPLSRLLKEAETKEHSAETHARAAQFDYAGHWRDHRAGIFVLTGQAAAKHAGPAVVYSFIVAAVTCAFAGLCYAEFAAMIPVAGSAYTYGYATLGEIFAWIIGWDLVLEYAFGAATVARGGADTLSAAAGLPYSHSAAVDDHSRQRAVSVSRPLAGDYGPTVRVDAASLPHVTGVFNLVAFIAIAVVTAVLVRGIQESANLNTVIVLVKLSVVGLFACPRH
jgi:APA family basic amino acid/polyamine antiporter